MYKNLIIIITLLLLAGTILAGDLYKMDVKSQADADFLNDLHAIPVLSLEQGYIVLVPEDYRVEITNSGLNYELIKSNVSREELFLQSLHDSPNLNKKSALYSDGDIYLIQSATDNATYTENINNNIFQVPDREGKVRYNPIASSQLAQSSIVGGLDTLIAKISQDSLNSYLHRLQAFNGRVTGTDSSYASRDWILNKFKEFGYTDAYNDPFIGEQLYSYIPVSSFNVIAKKVGTKYPDKHILITGHYDAVPTSPGADDNGTGTAAVLEIARIFSDIETDMTIIFIAFDSEESGLHGAYHYADLAYAQGEDIVVVLNADMIGNIGNTNTANLFTGSELGYAYLWNQLSDSLVGISAFYSSSSSSDHFPFQVNGYDVVFVHERIFSTVYHSPLDSTTYVDFDYFTRMTKGTIATAYTVSQSPPPVHNIKIAQPGDGSSLFVSWDLLPMAHISNYYIYYYKTSVPSVIDSIQISNTVSSHLLQGLDEGFEYGIYIKAFNSGGNTSIAYDIALGTPSSVPVIPEQLTAFPSLHKIELIWKQNNEELDFDHYNIYRDSLFLISVYDTFYTDNAPSLGSDLHEYYVTAVDTTDIESENSESVISRTATLEKDRILALNRSTFASSDIVDEAETGLFLEEALDGYNYDYFSDTAYSKVHLETERFNLFNMLDYEIVIIGAEAGLANDIAMSDDYSDLSETIKIYLAIGGKLIVFGRFGDFNQNMTVTNYTSNSPSYMQIYRDCFDISSRVSSPSVLIPLNYISSELIGAKSLLSGYPNLTWDSILTAQHTSPYIATTGIPSASYVTFNSPNAEVIYTYDSHELVSTYEDKPVAWKNIVGPNKYVYYDIPLSFFGRADAITALRHSITDLMDIPTDLPDNDITTLPQTITLSQNYPNPFNPTTNINFSLPEKSNIKISVFNILGQNVKTLTDELYPAGNHSVVWDGTNSNGKKVSSGIYLYKLVSDDYATSKKMILLK